MDAQLYEILAGFPALVIAAWVINLLFARMDKQDQRYHDLVEQELDDSQKMPG